MKNRLEKYTSQELAQMPSLASGHFDELKMEEPKKRWWLTRMGFADGQDFEIVVEVLEDSQWEVAHVYSPMLDPDGEEAQVIGDMLLESPDLISLEGDLAVFSRELTPNESGILNHRGIYEVGEEEFLKRVSTKKNPRGRSERADVIQIGTRGLGCGTPGPLDSSERYALPDWAFALPGKGPRSSRKYPLYTLDRSGHPVPSRTHAVSAKGRAKSQLLKGTISPAQYLTIVSRSDKVIEQCPAGERQVTRTTRRAANPTGKLKRKLKG